MLVDGIGKSWTKSSVGGLGLHTGVLAPVYLLGYRELVSEKSRSQFTPRAASSKARCMLYHLSGCLQS